jgi:hypothetical protein
MQRASNSSQQIQAAYAIETTPNRPQRARIPVSYWGAWDRARHGRFRPVRAEDFSNPLTQGDARASFCPGLVCPGPSARRRMPSPMEYG